jgi:hypothetical protein
VIIDKKIKPGPMDGQEENCLIKQEPKKKPKEEIGLRTRWMTIFCCTAIICMSPSTRADRKWRLSSDA